MMLIWKPIKRFVSSPVIFLFAAGFILAACSDTEEVYVEQPVEQLYNKALNEVADMLLMWDDIKVSIPITFID